MQRTEKIPSKPDFYFATRRAYEFLIELGITSLPVDPFDIIKKHMDNCYISSWLDLRNETGDEDPWDIKKHKADAKVRIIRGTKDYHIVYDNTLYGHERIRWTIAHEIGHIVLGHFVKYRKTALNRGGLTETEYGVLETEAHWFAEALLAPNCLITFFGVRTWEEIRFLCRISKEASETVLNHVTNYNFRNDSLLEGKLIRNFYNFFYKEEYKQSMMDSINIYYNSPLYEDLVKHCRICKHCKTYITNGAQKYCHICGDKILPPEEYSPYARAVSGWFTYPTKEFLKGRHYRPVLTYKNNRVIYCPKCRNYSFRKEDVHCSSCGTELYNMCPFERGKLSGSDRYCPYCGTKSTFKQLGFFDIKYIEPKDTLEYQTVDISDYIEYEYWNFIKHSVLAFEKNLELFIALQDTAAYIDEDRFAIVSDRQEIVDLITKYEHMIVRTLRKYGNTEVNSVLMFCES